MANKIQFKRGLKANLPTLSVGEPAFTTDSKDLYIGSDTGNIQFAKNSAVGDLTLLPTVDKTSVVAALTEAYTTLSDNADTMYQELYDTANGKVAKDALVSNVKDHGLLGNGSSNDYTALSALITSFGSNKKDLFFPTGTYIIGTSITIPKNVRIILANGAVLSPNTGVTITINGDFVASSNTCFSGAGSVIGIGTVFPEWWGAIPDGTTDCSTAFEKAYACTESSLKQSNIIVLNEGDYVLSRTFHIYPAAHNNIKIVGSGSVFGTRLVSGNSFTGTQLMVVEGNTDSIEKIANFELRDFGIAYNNISVAPEIGLQIGSNDSAKQLIGLHYSIIENVTSGMKVAFLIVNARLFMMQRCSAWNSSISASRGLQVKTNGQFCGDFVIDNCQFVPNTTDGKCAELIANGAYGMKGIRFNDTIFYAAQIMVTMDASNGADFGDIWFQGCAWDGFSAQALIVTSAGTGTIVQDINIVNAYIRGITSTMFQFTATSPAKLLDVNINGGWCANLGALPFMFTACKGVKINGVNMYEVANASGGIFKAVDTAYLTYTANTVRQDTGYTSWLGEISGASDYYMVTNNITGSRAIGNINDTSTATHKIEANNL